MHEYMHLDEKWFYLTINAAKYIVTNKESSSYRHCRRKKTMKKVMFLLAVARPRFDEDRDAVFDGNSGLWLFVE